MSREHNSNCFNLALVAHIHPCMLQNPRLSNSVSANSLILFHLLTTHLHNAMLHSPISSALPTSPLIYQTESPGSVLGAKQHLLWNARCLVIMLCQFSSPPLCCKEIICTEQLSVYIKTRKISAWEAEP